MHAQACVCWSKYTTHDIIQVEQKYAACVKNKAHVCHFSKIPVLLIIWESQQNTEVA